ncbi:TetR/AcrR family transcriptional regulator [Paractinoplanes ferrugineus]|uniref:TetR/AcrR family transcriptional regulator n=1 Tax=Paractinoplanes ferrugineus TaxID=113564 RepID=UPI001EF27B14|nr:TetR/AcrR family transcriptional regulator [Actinoplanes ferrugineus]
MRSRTPAEKPLRADAARNRDAIVGAARRAFAELGLQVPFDEIARRAGVGEATLHRRFPDRESLIAAAFTDKMTDYADAAAQALADPDPWAGFCGYVRRVCAMQSGDRGFADLLTLTFSVTNPAIEDLEGHRARAYRDWVTIVRRAKTSGQLRADFHPSDMILLLMANAGVVAATTGTAPHAGQRLVEYLLQAFAGGCALELPAPAPRGALVRAMHRSQQTAD